jgi:hypothetical protein
MDTEEIYNPPQDDDEFDVPDEESNVALSGDLRSVHEKRNMYSQMSIRGNQILSKSVNKTNMLNKSEGPNTMVRK